MVDAKRGKTIGLSVSFTLPVFGEPLASSEPREGALWKPSVGQNYAFFRRIQTLDNFAVQRRRLFLNGRRKNGLARIW